MKAIVVKPFSGVPDGKVYAEDFRLNDVVEGRLAGVAVTQGWAVPEGGELPPDPATLRAEADAEIDRIKKDMDEFLKAAAAEKAVISTSVQTAKAAAADEIAKIKESVTAARTAADAELDAIRVEADAAKKAAADEDKGDSDLAGTSKAKAKADKE